ncbi:MAG: hypothetical protein LC687_00955 [Actinobacteria bacterium]|nr:hypothetical protein [Actinomycetota bacterium]
MSNSILTSTKKVLGIEEEYTAFDVDISMHINSVFATLNQLGLGPEDGFMMVDKTDTWSAFFNDDPRLNSIKTYVYLKVRLLFDPPGTSYLIQALERQADELTWRLNAAREDQEYSDPFVEEA